MKKRGLFVNFMITMAVFGLLIVLLWVAFYYITRRTFVSNMIAQAEALSDAITADIEDELLSMDDTAYELAHYDRISAMMTAQTAGEFYEYGQTAAVRSASIIGNYCPADNIIVLRDDVLFYRLKGQMSNTAIKRVYRIIQNDAGRILTVASGGMTYIGCSERIESGNGQTDGYVVLMMERSRLKEMLSSYNDIDYIGVAITVDDELICANLDIDEDDLVALKADSVFYKEKAIGLTGFDLHIYCANTVSEHLGRYFRAALPLTIGILMLVMALFVRYWNRHIVGPIDSIIDSTIETPDKPIPQTGEEYFDDLVDNINDALLRIEDKDRQLYESDLRIKESELMTERTLMTLLKKQISAHFTVNTMSVVRALINKGDKQTATGICDELSGLLRYANAGDEYISLMEEFRVLEQYAAIMQVRYPGKFTFDAEPEERYSEYYIPRMLLQPIVENSITHGFVGRTGTVTINADIGDKLCITIADDGRGIPFEKLSVLKEQLAADESPADKNLHHVALINIQKRIRIVCGEGYGLNIASKEGKGTSVTLTLPVRKDKYLNIVQ